MNYFITYQNLAIEKQKQKSFEAHEEFQNIENIILKIFNELAENDNEMEILDQIHTMNKRTINNQKGSF